MSLLSNALSGLNAANIGLIVAGQNTANEAVEGYSRQGMTLATSSGNLNGVSVVSVDRIVNSFYNDDIWRTQADLSHYEGLQSYLGYLEELMGTDSLNLNNSIADITTALNASMTNPESTAYRQEVLAAAESLIQDLAQLNSAINGQLEKMSNEMSDLSTNASSVMEQIADYNQKVALAKAKGDSTAELEDARETLVTQLSEFIGVDVNYRDDGQMDISTLSGAPLVIGRQAASLSVNGTEVTSTLSTQSFLLHGDIGGRLGGLITAENDAIQPTIDSLNDIVTQLADGVNNALAEGFDLNGTPGEPMFTYNAANPIGSLALSDTISVETLAFIGGEDDGAGGWVATGGAGDNNNLSNIIAAFESQGDSYTSLVGRLATESRQNQSSVATAQALTDNAVSARDSLSGVNLDEEAANILHFQQLYQANAKVMATADELFNTLLASF